VSDERYSCRYCRASKSVTYDPQMYSWICSECGRVDTKRAYQTPKGKRCSAS